MLMIISDNTWLTVLLTALIQDFCVYYKRQLKTIMLTSLKIGMRIMEESTKVRLLKSGSFCFCFFLILKNYPPDFASEASSWTHIIFFQKGKATCFLSLSTKTFKNSDTLTAIVLTVNTVYCINKDCLKIFLLLDTGKECVG